ncbi:hypothetical protein FRC02_000994 [Tulasnella sp. 418]|nr:hypothetical protein FRC02_000994 [Tulasnella sp. 418]
MSSNPSGSKSKLKQGPTSGSAIRQATRSSAIRRRPIPKHPDDGIALAKPAPPGESIASRTSLWPAVESTENQNAEICKVYNPETALPWPGQLPCSAQRKKRGETGPCR